jgi:hypothetical protein
MMWSLWLHSANYQSALRGVDRGTVALAEEEKQEELLHGQ